MKPIAPENIKVFSAIFHGLLAGFVVLVLFVITSYGYTHELLVLWGTSIVFSCIFGWVFSSWYVPIKDEPWCFESAFVTPIISLLSAVFSGLLFMLVTEMNASVQHMHNLRSAFVGGIFIGLYAFLLTLPVTAIVGVAVALYFHKFCGYKNIP